MRLSEHEQRLLAEVERALMRDDPKFAKQFVAVPRRTSWWRGFLRLLRVLRS
jgi:Protein of unknown function (DUF3040)